MKVVRNVKRYRDAAKLEIKVLNTLKNSDPYGLRYVPVNLCFISSSLLFSSFLFSSLCISLFNNDTCLTVFLVCYYINFFPYIIQIFLRYSNSFNTTSFQNVFSIFYIFFSNPI